MKIIKNLELRPLMRKALKEDIGRGDITTKLIIPKDRYIKAILLANEDFIICGLDVARRIFKLKDRNIKFKSDIKDGQKIRKGRIIATLWGKAQGILTAERVALNFLTLLSGIATKTREYVDAVKPYNVSPVRNNEVLKGKISNGVRIMDTRKTIPGLRELEKYAVRVGGGYNHRLRLDEMVLVKDNHLAASCVVRPLAGRLRTRASCVKKIIETIKKKKPKNVKIEIEVKNLREFKEALKAEPDIIMLDNMKIADMKKAVEIKRNTQYAIRHTLIEASGGITLKNVKKIASCGVDMISIGELTHSIDSIDISLEII